ncbi:hypothetical protein IWQ60_011206 [Tieghemiomyces parasiticus]|uniref:Large ribosomal subunit protein uL30-like ferredoxin-like fold domain-containing protein n=1 Tax=Tieghemiomyces parasiticus TaxID=78921 RepID=A0A9W7ZHQ9_9FUNG|nr:hypothetical protein IWQ60_011206 [Tieghemiomyces parasiticus]
MFPLSKLGLRASRPVLRVGSSLPTWQRALTTGNAPPSSPHATTTTAKTPAPRTTQAAMEAMRGSPKLLRVHLYRSLIGLHKRTRLMAESLGLKKIGSIKVLPALPHIVGNLVQLKEIIRLEIVQDKEIPKIRPAQGYTIAKKFNGDPYL